jgi:hypothetical protein
MALCSGLYLAAAIPSSFLVTSIDGYPIRYDMIASLSNSSEPVDMHNPTYRSAPSCSVDGWLLSAL